MDLGDRLRLFEFVLSRMARHLVGTAQDERIFDLKDSGDKLSEHRRGQDTALHEKTPRIEIEN
jgi:hypothetical protein